MRDSNPDDRGRRRGIGDTVRWRGGAAIRTPPRRRCCAPRPTRRWSTATSGAPSRSTRRSSIAMARRTGRRQRRHCCGRPRRIGSCGDPQAKQTYQQIVTQYADQTAVVTVARSRLAPSAPPNATTLGHPSGVERRGRGPSRARLARRQVSVGRYRVVAEQSHHPRPGQRPDDHTDDGGQRHRVRRALIFSPDDTKLALRLVQQQTAVRAADRRPNRWRTARSLRAAGRWLDAGLRLVTRWPADRRADQTRRRSRSWPSCRRPMGPCAC